MKYFPLLLTAFLFNFNSNAQTFSRDTNIPVTGPNGPLTMPWAGGLDHPNFSEIDLNGDGHMDLFAYDKSNNRVVTFLSDGTQSINGWTYAPQYADQFPPLRSWAFLYDYNCDGKPDIFTCTFNNNGISQYRNDTQGGNLSFTLVDSSMKYVYNGVNVTNIGSSAYLVPTFNDLDNDGDMDIIGHTNSCANSFVHYINMSMEHTGRCDSLNDYVIEHNIWGYFTLRAGAYKTVAVGAYNVSCPVFAPPPPVSEPVYQYQPAVRDDTYAGIFTIDIDGDGDKDAIIGDSGANNSLLVVNGGDSSLAMMDTTGTDTLFPSYDTSVYLHAFTMHAYADCDNDGLKDLIVTASEWENNHGVLFYKNTGSNAMPHFSNGINDFLQNEMIDVGEGATAVLVDENADGLKDLIIGNRYRTLTDSLSETTLTLYRNTGTLTSPSFTFITKDYTNISSLHLNPQIYPAFGDIDNDGDIDMLVGLDDGHLIFYQNTAGPGVPLVFAPPVFNYQSIDVGQSTAPQLVDLNRDGFLDLVIGQKNGLIKYYENTQSLSTPFNPTATSDTLGGIVLQYVQSIDGYSAPFVFDQNGSYRLAASYLEGTVLLYGNIDGNLNGNFTVIDTILDKKEGNRYGFNLSVSGGDLNGDTLTDLVFGLYSGGVQIFYQDNFANGISTFNNEKTFSVYPNPAADKIVIKTNGQSGKCMLTDISGRVVTACEIKDGFAIMDVSRFSVGTYFVRMTSQDRSMTKKIVINR